MGMKYQHALRAFTAKDRKAIKLAAENYPLTEYYQTNQLLTKLGIGEALISVLDEKGRPTPLVHTLLRAPASRMDVISKNEQLAVLDASELREKYNETIDRKSAYEILNKKLEKAAKQAEKEAKRLGKPGRKRSSRRTSYAKQIGGRVVTTVVREITRGILGVLGFKKKRRTRRRYRR